MGTSFGNIHCPSYTKDCFRNNVAVYWYNQEFSQSGILPGRKISKACTLICLLVAQKISEAGLLIREIDRCTKMIEEAMLDGNAIHAKIVKDGLISHPYLNTQEALKFGGKSLNLLKEWTFQIFSENIEFGLFQYISAFLNRWYKIVLRPKNLFMLLITCGRTVLFIFQEETYMVTFFDSHSHSTHGNPNRGLVIAQAPINKLECLCNWYTENILKKCYNAEAKKYELAFLYPHNSMYRGCDSLCNCSNHCKKS